MNKIWQLLLVTLFFLTGCALAQPPSSVQPIKQTTAFSAEDYYQFKQLDQVTLSASGEILAFVQTEVSVDRRSRESTLWLHRLGQAQPQQFTTGKQDHSPLFSPQADILLFQGSRPGVGEHAGKNISGLYQMPLNGGEPRLLLHLPQAQLQQLVWHPDGKSLYLTLSHQLDVTEPRAAKTNITTTTADSHLIRYAAYKRQGGYRNEQQTSLWQYHLASDSLTRLAADFPHNIQQFALSPNGEQLVFSANPHPDAKDGAFASDLFLLDLQQPKQVKNLVTGNLYAGQALWLNNHELAYLHRENTFAAPSIYRISSQGENKQALALHMEHSPGQLQQAQNALWFIADHQGSRVLFKLALDGSGYQEVTGEGFSLSALATNSDGTQWAWLREHETQATELVRVSSDQPHNDIAALYNPNAAILAKLQLIPYERFTIQTTANETYQPYQLEVFFLPPAGPRKANTPVILNIKGGPGGMWGHQWFPENQLFAAQGYAVVFVNYRGSTGYGYQHQNSVRLDYGGVDYFDNIQALDAALARYPWLSADHQYITGGSHGGFLTNWATTQTQRFRAAVTQRSVSNWVSEAGTQTYPPYSMQQEFGGTIWQNFDYYWGRSPLKYADRVTTPTLIIHSTDDHITPIGQGEEWFYALKANQVPVEMVVFSGEGHGLSRTGKPVNLVERLNQIIGWFERYQK